MIDPIWTLTLLTKWMGGGIVLLGVVCYAAICCGPSSKARRSRGRHADF